MSTGEFWSARPELAHVRLFAQARQASPWAVLGVVLARAVATTPPTVVLPPTIGTTASMNLFVAVVSRPGGGKGAAEGAGRDAIAWADSNGVSIDVPEFPIGSGEGIARTFCPSGDDEVIDRALFSAPEIDTMTALGSRTGATLMPELRKVFMGERLGFTNAQKSTRTMVQEHTYRACLVVGVQELRAGTMLADADGGTPQRFLWLPAFDPEAPDTPPACPQSLNVTAPRWADKALAIPDRAVAEIRAHRTAVLRGQALDPLDGHRMLTRLKVASALMVLGGRTIVSVEDWQLADIVMRVSDQTRTGVEAAVADRSRKANRDRAVATADRDDIVSDRKVARTYRRDPPMARQGGDGRERTAIQDQVRPSGLLRLGHRRAGRGGSGGIDRRRARPPLPTIGGTPCTAGTGHESAGQRPCTRRTPCTTGQPDEPALRHTPRRSARTQRCLHHLHQHPPRVVRMTPRDLINADACTARCLLAVSPASTCRCACQGAHHSALMDADITGLIEARRAGLHLHRRPRPDRGCRMKPPTTLEHKPGCRWPALRVTPVDGVLRDWVRWTCRSCSVATTSPIVLPSEGETWTREDILAAIRIRARRPLDIPKVLADIADKISRRALAWALPQAWQMCGAPALALPRDEWLTLWRSAGFTSDGVPAPRPTEPVHMFRGARREHRRGMAWTDTRAVAVFFTWAGETPTGQRYHAGPPMTLAGLEISPPEPTAGLPFSPVVLSEPVGKVYRVTAPPEAILGQFRWRSTWEYVIDPTGLKIKEAS